MTYTTKTRNKARLAANRQFRIARAMYKKKRYNDRSRLIERIKSEREKRYSISIINREGFKGILEYLNKINEFVPARRTWRKLWSAKRAVIFFSQCVELNRLVQNKLNRLSVCQLFSRRVSLNSFFVFGRNNRPSATSKTARFTVQTPHKVFTWSYVLNEFWKLMHVVYLDWYFEWPELVFLDKSTPDLNILSNTFFDLTKLQYSPEVLNKPYNTDILSFFNPSFNFDRKDYKAVLLKQVESGSCVLALRQIYYYLFVRWSITHLKSCLVSSIFVWPKLFNDFQVSRVNPYKPVGLVCVRNRFHNKYLSAEVVSKAKKKLYLRYLTLVRLNRRKKVTLGFQDFVKRITRVPSERRIRKMFKLGLRNVLPKSQAFRKLYHCQISKLSPYFFVRTNQTKQLRRLNDRQQSKGWINVIYGNYTKTYKRRYRAYARRFLREALRAEVFSELNEEYRPMCDDTLSQVVSWWQPFYHKLRYNLVSPSKGLVNAHRLWKWVGGNVYLNLKSSNAWYLFKQTGIQNILYHQDYVRAVNVSTQTKALERKMWYSAADILRGLNGRLPNRLYNIDIQRTILHKFLYNIKNLLKDRRYLRFKKTRYSTWSRWHKFRLRHSYKSRWINFSQADIFEFA